MAESAGGKFSVEECERLISQVRDVVSAKIVLDRDMVIREIHLLAGSSRSPKQIVRDIESIFAAQYGINIDHKKISIAQLDGGEVKKSEGKRLKLDGLSFSTNGPKAEVKVHLHCGEEHYEGNHAGPRSKANYLRLVAIATVAAVERCISTECFITVEDVAMVNLGKHDIVNVVISILTPEGEEVLVGSSLTKNDERDAVARAVLCALNRRFLQVSEPESSTKTL